MKYISIGFILAFFIFITIVGLRNIDKPATGHLHTIKPEDEHYIVKEKLPPHVKTENIIFRAY